MMFCGDGSELDNMYLSATVYMQFAHNVCSVITKPDWQIGLAVAVSFSLFWHVFRY